MKTRLALSTLCLFCSGVFAIAAGEALVAHWDFNEGKGDVLHDRSGHNNHGKIHGAKWVKCGDGHALRFDGTDDHVNCGTDPSLDIRGPISLEAWVLPEGVPKGEPGILGKQFSSYLLTYYRRGKCYWYICEGANNCNAGLSAGSWSHIVGTYNGTTMTLYVNGTKVARRRSTHEAINAGKHLAIGCVIGAPTADDPAYITTSYFKGTIDEVRIYTRALSENEVRNHYERMLPTRTVEAFAELAPVREGVRHRARDYALTVGDHGAMQIDIGRDAYLFESSFSYPGKQIGFNHLSVKPVRNEAGWRAEVTKSKGGIQVAARGRHYSLLREMLPRAHRIEIRDTLSNLTDAPVGILISNSVIAAQVFRNSLFVGTPENPTAFLGQPSSRLGILAEDNVARIQFESMGFANQSGFELKHFALDARKSYTLEWAIYPFREDADYFTFVNRVREDWNANFTIAGPFQFINGRGSLVGNPALLRACLKRKTLKVIALGPWLDYYTGQDLNRAQTRQVLQKAVRTFREVDPTIKCVGEIETDWVSLRPEQIPGFEKLPAHKGGRTTQAHLTPAQMTIIEKSSIPWKDSLTIKRSGRVSVELYTCYGRPFSAINVYPRAGNYQHDFMMDQVRFIMEEIGMDGYYVDDFNQTWRSSYSGWDGTTVDIDPATGQIKEKYVNCGLAGIRTRKGICEYGVSRGSVLVANTAAAVSETQSFPVNRFLELPFGRTFDPLLLKDGEKPPFMTTLCRGHLASPISLGLGLHRLSSDPKNYARAFIKGIIVLLRNGIVYYHHDPDIPETGPGAGEYGPINHMFPITPVRLFAGGIEGRERTITCVSGTYTWNHDGPPRVFLFDEVGRETKHNIKPVNVKGGWKVPVKLRDWQQIAVIEE